MDYLRNLIFFIKSAHSQAGSTNPQPRRSTGNAGAHSQTGSATPQLGRSAGSAVHKFTKFGLFNTLQALYILILLIPPCAICNKREKCQRYLGTKVLFNN